MNPTTSDGDPKEFVIHITAPPRSPSDTYYVQLVGVHDRKVGKFWRALGIPEHVRCDLRQGERVRMHLTPHDWCQVVLWIDLENLPISVLPVEGDDDLDTF